MLNSFELKSEHIKRFNYHWLWGLRYDDTPRSTRFEQDVNGLFANKDEFSRIKFKQYNFYNKPRISQFFMWLFNIENYTYNSYVLSAYEAHYNDLNDDSTESQDYPVVRKTYLSGLRFALDKIYRCVGQNRSYDDAASGSEVSAISAPVIGEREPILAQAATGMSHPKRRADDSIIITSAMRPHLNVLGISKQVGHHLSVSNFKSASRKRYLATHPDKGGAHDDFVRVNNAITSLKEIISATPDNYSLSQDLSAIMVKIRENLASARDSYARARDSYARARDSYASARDSYVEMQAIFQDKTALSQMVREAIRARLKQIDEENALKTAHPLLESPPAETPVSHLQLTNGPSFFTPGLTDSEDVLSKEEHKTHNIIH